MPGAPIIITESGATPVTPTRDLGPLLTEATLGTPVTVAEDSAPVVIEGWFPYASVQPSIEGDFVVGEELTCLPGTWLGDPAFTYQWTRDGVAIPDAASDTYTLVEDDEGAVVACVVTATNDNGPTSAIAPGQLVEPA